MRLKTNIARLTLFLAAAAWLSASILLAKGLYVHASIFPLGQVNESLLGYALALLLGMTGAVFYIANRALRSKRNESG